MPNPAKIYKPIEDIMKENRDKDIILGDLDFTFDQDKDHQKSKTTVYAFNSGYIQYESIGNKDVLSIEEYLDMIRPYLSGIINDYKTREEWKIHLTMSIKFICSKDSDGTRIMHSKSDNIEIMMSGETDEINEELFESLLQRYQERLEQKMKGS